MHVDTSVAGSRGRGADKAGAGGSGCLRVWRAAGHAQCTGKVMVVDIEHFINCFPPLQELENTPNSPHLTLLNMFAYGNYSTLVDQKDNTPELTDVMTRKLRLLTIVSRVNLSQSTVCLRSAWRRQARCCRTASCRRSWASPPLGTWRTSSLRCISYL